MQKQRQKYALDELLRDETTFREWANRVIESIKKRAKK